MPTVTLDKASQAVLTKMQECKAFFDAKADEHSKAMKDPKIDTAATKEHSQKLTGSLAVSNILDSSISRMQKGFYN